MRRAKTIINKKFVNQDDESFNVRGATLVRFMNMGQSRVWIDEQIVVDPGDAYTEADESGIGIDHSYQIVFQTLSSPPTIDAPKVNAGNFLRIRIFKRVNQ